MLSFLPKQIQTLSNLTNALTIYQIIFNPLQTEGICRGQNKCDSKLKFVLGRAGKTVGKGENAGNPAFSPFPTMFQKASYSKS